MKRLLTLKKYEYFAIYEIDEKPTRYSSIFLHLAVELVQFFAVLHITTHITLIL